MLHQEQGAPPTTEAAEWRRSHQNPSEKEQGRTGKSKICWGWHGALTVQVGGFTLGKAASWRVWGTVGR